jgi:hypothetical protein
VERVNSGDFLKVRQNECPKLSKQKQSPWLAALLSKQRLPEELVNILATPANNVYQPGLQFEPETESLYLALKNVRPGKQSA